jgi:hypothetical protein
MTQIVYLVARNFHVANALNRRIGFGNLQGFRNLFLMDISFYQQQFSTFVH